MAATAISMADFEEAEAKLIENANEMLATWLAPLQIPVVEYPALEELPPEPKPKAKAPARPKRKAAHARTPR